jgi:hypothetical protein
MFSMWLAQFTITPHLISDLSNRLTVWIWWPSSFSSFEIRQWNHGHSSCAAVEFPAPSRGSWPCMGMGQHLRLRGPQIFEPPFGIQELGYSILTLCVCVSVCDAHFNTRHHNKQLIVITITYLIYLFQKKSPCYIYIFLHNTHAHCKYSNIVINKNIRTAMTIAMI